MIAENFEILINCATGTVSFYKELERAKNESICYWVNDDDTIDKLKFLDNSVLVINERERSAAVEVKA